jgi:hypothetical protein
MTHSSYGHMDRKVTAISHHINTIRPTNKFTVEVEPDVTLPFLDVLVVKLGQKYTGSLLILVVICTSSQITHIT